MPKAILNKHPNREIIKKVCLLGLPAVGKTAVIQRDVFDMFEGDNHYVETIGTKVVKNVVKDVHNPVCSVYADETLLIWDLNSDSQFERIMRTYFQAAEGAIVTFDNSRESTLYDVEKQIRNFKSVIPEKVPMVFLANKVDLDEISDYKIRKVADKYDAPYHYTSAKTGRGVKNAFKDLATRILEQMEFQ